MRAVYLHGSLVVVAAILFVSGARSHDYLIGPIKIGHPWARATPAAAKVGSGYLRIENTGPIADRLVGGATDAAARLEIHESTFVDGIARMREKADGVSIGPGAIAELKPSSIHLMLIDLKRPLKAGENVKATLRFEQAGEIEVEFRVQQIGAQQPPAAEHEQH